ncbi:MAG TPA: hypothetical protein PLK65_04610, partial [Candidatus Cloacimonas sp.]|nr:hypothetical protein [Candidatus Cloacimonas sp.]
LENRLNFNQEAKNADLNVCFQIARKKFLHTLSSGYLTFYDASDLEPSAYVNKTATMGYQINYTPAESLNIGVFSKSIFRNEQDRYVSGNLLSSNGYWLGSDIRYAAYFSNSEAGISTNAERKKMDWESFDFAQVNAN